MSSTAVTLIRTPVHLTYRITANQRLSQFLEALMQRRILGAACPQCARVYVPLREGCPLCGIPLQEEVLLLDGRGIVTTFCIINVPFEGQVLVPPYVGASILLEGADIPLFHLVGGVEAERVRMGMRVRPRWAVNENRTPGLDCIEYFEPTGEPDADYAQYASHL